MSLVKTLPLLLSLSAALGSVSAWALPNDSQQPIRIQADDAQLDDKNGVATYKGDVIITQGSMIVKGNTVTITRSASGSYQVDDPANLGRRHPDSTRDGVRARTIAEQAGTPTGSVLLVAHLFILFSLAQRRRDFLSSLMCPR